MKQTQQSENIVKVRKRAWLYAIFSASVIFFAAVIVLIVLAVNGIFTQSPVVDNTGNSNVGGNTNNSTLPNEPDEGDVNTGTTTSYVNPLESMTVITRQGFHYNSTLNCYYEHVGIDVSAEAGSEVYALCNATVQSIESGDVLSGTQITLIKDDGVTVVYGYVDPVESLSVGDKVTQGQVIAKVSQATGGEYKAGAHLHLEMYFGDTLADPAQYFTLSEK